MRNMLLVGLGLGVAAVLLVMASAGLDLDLESVVLLGVAAGAVVALVPDRTPMVRLIGFAGGFFAAWIGYVLRAGVLPDSPGGRAVTVAIVITLAVGVAAASLGRIPLWASVLGAGAFAGAYEYTFVAAPPEVTSTSLSAATALLLTFAVGFLVTAFAAPADEQPTRRTRPLGRRSDDGYATDRLDDLMMGDTK